MLTIDISSLPTLPMRTVKTHTIAPTTQKPNWLQRRSPGFWLRVCYLIFIVAIEGSALALLLLSTALPHLSNFDALSTPTVTTYQCAHVILAKASNGQFKTSIDYVCH